MLAFIPGFVIGWLTFPGVVMHEYAHKKACEWRDVRVNQVNYFKIDGSGSVSHGRTRGFGDVLAINIAPLFVNTVGAFVLYIIAAALYFDNQMVGQIINTSPSWALLFGWLALSLGWHAIPSFKDADNLEREIMNNWRSNLVLLFALPLVLLINLGNILSFLWFDAIYSISIGMVAITLLGFPLPF